MSNTKVMSVKMSKKMDEDKTPATILNEMMSRMQQIPMYETYKDEENPGNFICMVSCNNKTSRGTGRSKKDAKQNAAQHMIEIMYDSTVDKVSQDEYKDNFDNNDSVKKLRFMCTKYDIEKPTYLANQRVNSKCGPIYNCTCKVGDFETKGSGQTSNLAMQDSARKMIEDIGDFFTQSKVDAPVKKVKTVDNLVKFDNNNANSLEQIVSSSCCIKKSNSNGCNTSTIDTKKSNSSDFWMKLKNELKPTQSAELQYVSTLAKECIDNLNNNEATNFKVNFNKFQSLCQDFLKSLGINYHEMVIPSKDSEKYLYLIQLNLYFEIMEMSLGSTQEEAGLRAMSKILEVIKKHLGL